MFLPRSALTPGTSPRTVSANEESDNTKKEAWFILKHFNISNPLISEDLLKVIVCFHEFFFFGEKKTREITCNLTDWPSNLMTCVRTSTPIVLMNALLDDKSINFSNKQDFPTPESPTMTSLKV